MKKVGSIFLLTTLVFSLGMTWVAALSAEIPGIISTEKDHVEIPWLIKTENWKKDNNAKNDDFILQKGEYAWELSSLSSLASLASLSSLSFLSSVGKISALPGVPGVSGIPGIEGVPGVPGGRKYANENGFRTDDAWQMRGQKTMFYRDDHQLFSYDQNFMKYRNDHELWMKNMINGEKIFRNDSESWQLSPQMMLYRTDDLALQKTPEIIRYRDDHRAFEVRGGELYYRTDDALLIVRDDKIFYRTDNEVREIDGNNWKFTDDFRSYNY